MLNQQRQFRRKRVRAKLKGTAARPRCLVFRSNRHIYAQLIDDTTGQTLLGLSDQVLPAVKAKKRSSEVALAFGLALAAAAKARGLTKIVFDRRSYKYHGRVKALAEGARQGGLEF